MKSTAIIFPNQLFEAVKFKKGTSIYLVEEWLFFKQYAFHQQKIAFHRATMKFYESYLTKLGFEVNYIAATDKLSDIRKLLPKLKKDGISEIEVFEPVDNWLEKRIRKYEGDFNFLWLENPLFINTQGELKQYFKTDKKPFHQTDFYKQQRKQLQILMKGDEPEGGQWTYDADNRKKYPKGKQAPYIKFPESNEYVIEAISYTQKHFSKNYGKLSKNLIYPVTFKDAEDWFEEFLQHRFLEFGIYEDSIVKEENILHHSLLSPLLNIGFLDPKKVITQATAFAKKHKIPINSTEGFVRQILGWREFIRGLYERVGTKQRNSNFFKHHRKIPASFYTATTGIAPIDGTIKKLLTTGYVHHIERLMLLANFMNLCGIDPNEIYQWFMELFIDAYDWVMVPNVYGMSLFADGGLMSTKPYISGSNYVTKMSNYEKGEWQEIWDGLFWNFMDQHRSFFAKQPRLSMLLNSFDKMDADKREKHLTTADAFLKKLEKQ